MRTLREFRAALADSRMKPDEPVRVRVVYPDTRADGAYVAEELEIDSGLTGWKDGHSSFIARGNERPLTLERIAAVNRARCKRWHSPDTEPWSGADWSNAMCGEAGEAANVVKKLRRHETGTSPVGDPDEELLRAALGLELADMILYGLLVADHYGLDLEGAVVAKFNAVSVRQGFPERLP